MRLSELLDRATVAGARRRKPLDVDDLDEMIRLYRQAAADLAIARREFGDDRITILLNQLVTRAYGHIYRDTPAPFSQLRTFYVRDLPRLYRASWPYLSAAAALLFVPWLVMLALVVIQPDNARLMLSPGLIAEIKSGQTWFDSSVAERPALASFIMTNNAEVSLMALAGGMLAGWGTVAILVLNGLDLGAVSGALIAFGLGDRLVGFVAPHGFLELSVVVVSGGCGLMLGRALIWPELQTRSEALAEAGGRSVRLLLGLLPFLGVAGAIEGFVSPAHFAWPFKLAIGAITAALFYGYLVRAGREKARPSLTAARSLLAPGSD